MRTGPMVRAIAVAVVGGVALAALARAQGNEGDVERGRVLVAQNCASCHAIGAVGESPLGGAPPFRALSQRYPLEHLEEALAEGILVGHDGVARMPEFAFSPEDVGDILAYLATIQAR